MTATATQLIITNNFSDLVTKFNIVSSDLGATADLTTNVKTTIVDAINELEVGIRGVSNDLVATDLTTNATDLVGAINEIEGVFDASAFGISAGSTAFDITTTNASGISLAAPITSLTGHLSVLDDKEIRVGTGDDLILLHDATNSIVKGDSIYIKAKSADENMASFTYNGAVNLYHDNISRLATTSGGVSVPQDLELGAASVIKSGGNAAITFANADVTMGGNISIAGTVDGRDVSVDGTKLDTVETNADVTDTTNVTAAGALMDSELASIADVKALDQSVVSGATPAFTTTNFTDATNKRLMTDAQETKLDSVETNADVTDTTNVTAAGALMDSELASIDDVKALDQSVISGASPTFTTTNFTDATDKRLMTDAQESKLDAIESGATADQTAAEILTAIKTVDGAGTGLDADLLDGQHGSYYATAASVGTLGGLDSDISADGNLVVAINELQGDIRQINANGATANNTIIGTLTELNTDAKDTIVDAINEIEGIFDASDKGISAGTDAFNVVSGAFGINASGAITLDATGDIVLKDAGVVFSTLENSGGNLIVKSGTTTALTFSGANVIVAGDISVGGTVDGRDIAADGTKLDGIENNATADQTDAEIRAAVEAATDSNVFTDAEKTKLTNIETSATADQNAAQILAKLITVDGASSGLDADLLDGQHGSHYGTASDVSTNATAIGTLSSLTTTEKGNLVAALNELKLRLPLVYNASGTLLN